MSIRSIGFTVLVLVTSVDTTLARVLQVDDTDSFRAALRDARPGDAIHVAPGVYGGGHFRAGLSEVVIRRQPGASGEAIFRGGVNGIQLTDAVGVTLEGLTFEAQTGNGLNIDDGGSFATPSRDLIIRDVTVRDLAATGNNDGIKLSGVTGFLIDRVRIFDWGARGSAIDPVGSHHGVIRNSHLRSTVLTDGGSVIRPKGGSKEIEARGNLIELPAGAGRALQAGGATGAEFFRFIDGDSGYEADSIRFYGNRVLGGSSAANWVNIDGGEFRFNDFRGPTRWAMRILNENSGAAIVDTLGGVFADNYVEFDGNVWSRAVNVGPETDPASFLFARNRWRNLADPTPAGSTPALPASETDGVYGAPAPWAADAPMRWEFAWGAWIVPATTRASTLEVPEFGDHLVAQPLDGGEFDPLAADPLSGAWRLRPARPVETITPFDDLVLIRPDACAICQTIPGDYDHDGNLTPNDAAEWRLAFGYAGQAPLADGNSDGRVDAADYTVWRDASAAVAAPVPEPATGMLIAAALAITAPRRSR